MTIKEILYEIASEPGSNKKIEILTRHKENKILERVLYLAYSNRIKFYIRQIPNYNNNSIDHPIIALEEALEKLDALSSREKTGHNGINYLIDILCSLIKDDSYVIERIIDKDLKIGMARTSINKVFPKLIEKTPYMGARAFSEKLAREILDDGMAYSQVKMDGRYCNAIIENGVVHLESRSGETTLITGAKIIDELSRFDDCVLNGELTIHDVDRNTSNGIINSVISITSKIKNEEDVSKDKDNISKRHNITYENALNKIVYTVWDIIEIDDYHSGKCDSSYNDRMYTLMSNILTSECKKVEIIEHEIVTTYEQAMEHFIKSLSRGLEGTILKSYKGIWKDSKPKWQIKMKLEIDIDMKIIGFNYGTLGSKNEHVISSLTVESSCSKVVTRPGGISELDMIYITNNQDKLLGSIIEMKCCGLSHDNEGNYSTLHPVFKLIRDDKDSYDSLESIIKIENMAKSLTFPELSKAVKLSS